MIRKAINADFIHNCIVLRGSPPKKTLAKIKLIIFSYGFQTLCSQRIYWQGSNRNRTSLLFAYPVMIIGYILRTFFALLYDIRIDATANIGTGLYIGHFGGLRIGYSDIGDWCNINQQVKIGDMGSRDPSRKVVIGSRVWIGAHAHIKAGVTIGDGATISAGAVVTTDVPARALVAGATGRILSRNYDNSTLLG